jgi:hypothetical protein
MPTMKRTLQLTKQDVAEALKNVLDLDGSGSHDQFDVFLARPIEDPYLEAIRLECLEVVRKDRAPPKGKDISESTAEWVRGKLRELQVGI